MRLSEKTIELNLCAQINQNSHRQIIWFGLTQVQEAKAGFDAAFKLNARMLLFQFKASNKTLRSGARQFKMEHGQLQKLIDRVNGFRRSIFYVFPMIGDTLELSQYNGDFYNNSWTLDVSSLPNPFPLPLSKTFPHKPRKNNTHYADVMNNYVRIHSDPVEAKIESLKNIVESNFAGADGINKLLFEFNDNYDKALEILRPFRKNFKMGILLP